MTELSNSIHELFAAIQQSDVERVKSLIEAEISFEQKNADGRTPLTLACGVDNPEIVQLLIAAGAKVNLKPDLSVEEDLEPEPATPLGAAVVKGHTCIVRMLLEAGIEPNSSVWHETPALVEAARQGHVDIVQVLIAAGANVNGGFYKVPLYAAAREGHLEVVRVLLDAGANIEGYEWYWTALIIASFKGHLSIVQLLIERGANIHWCPHGENVLMIAARGARREVYEFLYPLVPKEWREIGDRNAEREMAKTLRRRARGVNKAVEKLIKAVVARNLEQVRQLITEGVDVNAIAICDKTPLSLAVKNGQISIIEALLDAGADPNLSDQTDDGFAGNSPLMEAVSTDSATNQKEMIHLLIRHGANPNHQNFEGKTVLMVAVECADRMALRGHSQMDVIEALIQIGVNLDIRDNEGYTALMAAGVREFAQIVNLLKKAGASQKGFKKPKSLRVVDRSVIGNWRTF